MKLLREPGVSPTAWKMYKFSLYYLFLLFGAMGVDRLVPSDAWRPSQVLHLQRATGDDESTLPPHVPTHGNEHEHH